ncbi:MAG TPA: hypothetical protein VGM06_01185 [Polyangiaceae bacterium]|jgi:hypothetical protein
MSDPERPATATHNLRALAQRLLEQARQLGDAEAVTAAEKVHEHAHAETPNTASLASHLATLKTRLQLSPTVNAILDALSNVGL